MPAFVEQRFTDTGFVYVGDTRMLYAPKSIVERTPGTPNEPLVLRPSSWGLAAKPQIRRCVQALKRYYPDRDVVVAQT